MLRGHMLCVRTDTTNRALPQRTDRKLVLRVIYDKEKNLSDFDRFS